MCLNKVDLILSYIAPPCYRLYPYRSRNKLTKTAVNRGLTAGRSRFNRGLSQVRPRADLGSTAVRPRNPKTARLCRVQIHDFAECNSRRNPKTARLCRVQILYFKNQNQQDFCDFKCIQKVGKQYNGKALFVYSRKRIVSILLLNPQLYRAISCMHL